MPVGEILTAVAANVLTNVFAGDTEGISKKELKKVLETAFTQFRESYQKVEGDRSDETLAEVWEEFFRDDRTLSNLKLIFEGRGDDVDIGLLMEIFEDVCGEKRIKTDAFNFYEAVKVILQAIETLARGHEGLRATFQAGDIGGIYRILEQRGTERNVSIARYLYLTQLSRHNKDLKFTGIPDPVEKNEIDIPSIFVMPRVSESVPVDYYMSLIQEMKSYEGTEFTDDEIQLNRKMEEKQKIKTVPIKLSKVLEDSGNHRFVVLGEPGSGKSTLLKYLLLHAVQECLGHPREEPYLPILVEIRRLELALGRNIDPGYNVLDFLYDSIKRYYSVVLPEGFFESYLEKGRVLLMFDGLDEVAAESRRAEVQQMISTFVSRYNSGNRVIVTSRIAGYSRARFSTTAFRHFTLEDFNDEEIDEFIRHWYGTRERNPTEAELKIKDLKNTIEKKPRIRELTRNPLLLTIVGVIHRYEADLPEDRLMLYDKATEALLHTWDNVRGIPDSDFGLENKRRFLEKVGFQLQSMEKGDEAGTLIERYELHEILLEEFCKVFNCDKRDARGKVDQFLEHIRLRAGLLTEMGPDRFGFVHKTFQEYFAAKWIANEAMLNFDLNIMWEYVGKYIDNSFWHETLLLSIRALPNKQALNILKRILGRDERGIEELVYYNHFFVMKFLAEQGKWLQDRAFVEKNVMDFFEFSWYAKHNDILYCEQSWKRFYGWLPTVTDSLSAYILSEKLLEKAQDGSTDDSLRQYCIKSIGQLGMNEESLVKSLLEMAEDFRVTGFLRRSCVESVGQIRLKEEWAIQRLLEIVENESALIDLRSSCAEALGQLGIKEEYVVSKLVDITEDDGQDNSLRSSCAASLGKLDIDNTGVAAKLMKIAEDKRENDELRSACAYSAGRLGVKGRPEEILNTIYLAKGDKYSKQAHWIYYYLEELSSDEYRQVKIRY